MQEETIPKLAMSSVNLYGLFPAYGIVLGQEHEKDVYTIAAKYYDAIIDGMKRDRAIMIRLVSKCVLDMAEKGLTLVDAFAFCAGAAVADAIWAALLLAAYVADTPEQADKLFLQHMIILHKYLAAAHVTVSRHYREMLDNFKEYKQIAINAIKGREEKKEEKGKNTDKNRK